MAYQTGTATGMDDLMGKILTFVKANGWTSIVERRNNLADIVSTITSSYAYATTFEAARTEFKYTGVQAVTTYYATLFSPAVGTSYIQYNLTTPKAVTKVYMENATDNQTTVTQGMPNDIKLSWSDDGNTFTQIYDSGTTGADWIAATTNRTWTIPAGAAHKYWRLTPTNIHGVKTGSASMYPKVIFLLDANDVVVNHYGDEFVLSAPGSGQPVYVGLRTCWRTTNDSYLIQSNAYTGASPTGTFFAHPGAVNDPPIYTAISNAGMSYWLIVNERRICCVIKAAGIYSILYLGYFLPYCLPTQFPSPLIAGGSIVGAGPYDNITKVSLTSSANHSAFFTAVGATTGYVRDQLGGWGRIVGGASTGAIYTAPYVDNAVNAVMRDCMGGGYFLHPIVLYKNFMPAQIYGELDGLYWLPGFGNAAENTFTYNGEPYIIFRDTFRGGDMSFYAMRCV